MPRVSNPSEQGTKSEWLMWFHGRPQHISNDVVDLSTGNVYLASSEDGLSGWKLEGDKPCLAPGKESGDWWWFDSEHVGLGDVITPGKGAQSRFVSDDGVYLCYFFGGNSVLTPRPSWSGKGDMENVKGRKMEIGVAVSQDGLHWSKIEGSSPYSAVVEVGKAGEFDAEYVGWPFVLEDGKGYKMYYHTFDPKANKYVVGIAKSKDGIKWEKDGAVFMGGSPGCFDEQGAARCFVTKDPSGTYKMWYEGVSGTGARSIGLAQSANGVQWSRTSESPVFSKSTESSAWDHVEVGSPHLVWLESKKRWRLYYVGCGESGKTGIGVAESTDEKGTEFIRLNAL